MKYKSRILLILLLLSTTFSESNEGIDYRSFSDDVLFQDSQFRSFSHQQSVFIYGSYLILIILLVLSQRDNKKKQKQILEQSAQLDIETKSNEVRKYFIENFTNEIRTPITLIRGVIENSMESGKMNSDLLVIGLKSINQLSNDIENVLKFVRMESMKMKTSYQNVRGVDFFMEIIEHFKVNIFSKGMSLVFSHNLTSDTILKIDPEKVRIILSDYLSNIIRLSNESFQIHIDVKATSDKLCIVVKNNQNKPNIIDKLFEVNQEYSTYRDMGSGRYDMVLPLSKKLATLLQVHVYMSKDDKQRAIGFHLDIEINVNDILESSKTIKIQPKNNYSLGISASEKIAKVLVVDDSELMINFYKNILYKYYDCDYAFNGEKALSKIKDGNYECIIMDVMMPEIDGLEVVREIRKINRLRDLPIVLVTAQGFEDTIEEAFKLGIHDFIPKPFILNEFLGRISNVIKNNKKYNKSSIEEGYVNIGIDLGLNVNDDEEFVKKVIKTINKNMSNSDFGVEMLASEMFYSRRHFTRKIKHLTGLNSSQLILEIRLKKAYEMLKHNKNIRVGEVQNVIGFKSSAYFNKVFRDRFGINPSYVKNQEGLKH